MSLKNNIYYADDYIKEILFTTKSIAIVGLSDKENRPSYFAAKYLKNRGYKIIPVNPVTNKKTIFIKTGIFSAILACWVVILVGTFITFK